MGRKIACTVFILAALIPLRFAAVPMAVIAR